MAGTSYTFPAVTGDKTINATFDINTYTITATPGPNGVITPAGVTTINYGATATFNITPNSGYYVTGVVANGTSMGVVTSYTFTNVASNKTLNATFGRYAPTVTGISPTTGTSMGGTSVTITGTNLSSATNVWFGSNAAVILTNTDTSITVTSPVGSAGPVHITVTTAGGTSAQSASDIFRYYTIQFFNSTPSGSTWTVPSGVTTVEYLVVGGGGGGGASAAALDASTTIASNGGAGITSSISGASVTYAGGGGGGCYGSFTRGTGGSGGGGNGGDGAVGSNGQANTGGGGGRSTTGGGTSFNGGTGGSGIVIIKYY